VVIAEGNHGTYPIVPPPPLPDTTPPAISLSSPTNGSTARGTITVTANASDNVGVTRIDFYVDGKLFKTVTP
jgi:hypothetical protein